MSQDVSQHHDIETLAKLIKNIQFGMLTTIHDDGNLRSRPMTLQQTEFDGSLWFFTGKLTEVAIDVQSEPRVNVAFADIDKSSYISVTGRAELVEDREKMKELWSPAIKAFFPEGLEDPELVLIRVDVDSADYWDTPSSKVVQLYGFAKAIVTGQKVKIGERGRVQM